MQKIPVYNFYLSIYWILFYIIAFAKSSLLNISISSICSPTPINFTGILFSSTIPTTTPPLLEPSSFVNTRPVTSVSSLNAFTWFIAFWPVVASSTNSTYWLRFPISLFITFFIL